jgi:predicted membrane protein
MGSPMDEFGEDLERRIRERMERRAARRAERAERRGARAVYGVRIGPSPNGRLLFGIIILTLGVLWTLDNLGLVESGVVLQWWPAALILFGIAKLFGLGTRRNVVWGGTFAVAGAWLLAGNLDLIRAHLFSLWPLVLIAIGITIIMRAQRPTDAQGRVTGDDPSDNVSTFAFWSTVGRKALSQQFRGGDVSALMGAISVDLRGAAPVEEGAVIDLFVWWGGIDIIVPPDWKVINEATAIMGGIEDRTKTPPADARHTLILRGVIIMGGVEIKH